MSASNDGQWVAAAKLLMEHDLNVYADELHLMVPCQGQALRSGMTTKLSTRCAVEKPLLRTWMVADTTPRAI